MTDVIGAAEAGILARLEPLKAAGLVRAVDVFPGEWDDATLQATQRQVPGLFLHCPGGPIQQPSAQQPLCVLRWVVYCATAHAQGGAARSRGDSRQAGAWLLAQLAVSQLHHHTLSDLGSLEVMALDNLFSAGIGGAGLAVWAVTFHLPVTFAVGVPAEELDDFARLITTWDLAEADELPEATDHIELETA